MSPPIALTQECLGHYISAPHGWLTLLQHRALHQLVTTLGVIAHQLGPILASAKDVTFKATPFSSA